MNYKLSAGNKNQSLDRKCKVSELRLGCGPFNEALRLEIQQWEKPFGIMDYTWHLDVTRRNWESCCFKTITY